MSEDNDLFALKNISPMLLTESDPFDSENHIYELKLDGIRCVAYLDKNKTELRNKRNKSLNNIYPELSQMHQRIKRRCILDGELVILTDGKPDFYELQKRSLMSDKFKIELSAKQKPAIFVTFDILYDEDRQITDKPLLDRKIILQDTISENESLALSRYIHNKGVEFFKLASGQNLEGVVAKQKNSLYYFGKRTKDWVKFKKLHDSDFIICGYVPNEDGKIKSLVLGLYNNGAFIDQGHVSLGISNEAAKIIMQYAALHNQECPFLEKPQDSDTIWCRPGIVCTVQYMQRTESGHLRQPVFKGLSLDKRPDECILDY
jgi:bifunctional non-homologous end joining protein LigD